MNRKLGLATLASCLALTAGMAQAQDLRSPFGFEAGVSTLGAFVAPKYSLSDKVTLRAPIYFGGYEGSFDDEGTTVEGEVSLLSFALVADYQPWANGLRLSGGVVSGGYEITSSSQTSVTLDGNDYNGSFDATFQQENKIAPVLSVGYAKTFGNGLTLSADVGAKIGKYDLTVTSSTDLGADQAAFDEDLAEVNRELDQITATPFLSIGLGYRF